MVGAKHIVARMRLSGVTPDPRSVEQDPLTESPGREPPDLEDLADEFNHHPSMIGLEFMKHGDLYQFLSRVGDQNLRLRSEELWKIFHCRESRLSLSHNSPMIRGVL